MLEVELARVQLEWNTVRLHEAIGYVTPTTNTTDAAHRSGHRLEADIAFDTGDPFAAKVDGTYRGGFLSAFRSGSRPASSTVTGCPTGGNC